MLSHRLAIGFASGLVLCLGGFLALVVAAEDPPNFLIVLSNDHGIEYAGSYGNETVRTPNVDRLAEEGMRFSRAFTATAMCTPSRSTLYTGLLPHRHGAHRNHGATREGVKSLPMYLADLGIRVRGLSISRLRYRVGLAGKIHVKPGHVYPFQHLPRQLTTIHRFLTDPSRDPFCLVIATDHPHTPYVQVLRDQARDPEKLTLPPYLVDTPETRVEQRDYYNSVEALDRELGDYLQMLDDLGLSEETVVFYTSDNGAPFPFGKWTLYDSGLRVPFIVRWTGHIEAGTVTDAMISFADVLPTIIELAGGKPPEDIDGRSFADVLKGKTTKHRDAVYGTHTNLGIISASEYPIRAIRTERHKYIRNLNSEGTFKNIITEGYQEMRSRGRRPRSEPWGPGPMWRSWLRRAEDDPAAAARVEFYQKRPAEELYELEKDPFELNNLADDPASRAIKSELRKQLDAWMRQQGDPLARKRP